MSGRTIIEPVPTPDSEAFWDAAKAGRFLIRRCPDCGRAHWYPRPMCPLCGAPSTAWVEASGRARVYSYSVMDAAAQPYAIAYVRLEEGPIMMTNLVDCDFDAIKIDAPLTLTFLPTPEGFALPCFTLAEEAAQ